MPEYYKILEKTFTCLQSSHKLDGIRLINELIKPISITIGISGK